MSQSMRPLEKTDFPCYLVQQDVGTGRAERVAQPRSAIASFTEELRANPANESVSGRGRRSPDLGILAFPCKVNLSRGWSETLCEVTGGWLLPGISSCISNKAVMRLNFLLSTGQIWSRWCGNFWVSMNLVRQTDGSLRCVVVVVGLLILISIIAVQILVSVWIHINGQCFIFIYIYWLLYLNNNRVGH